MAKTLIEGFQLSPQQKRLWLLQKNDPAGAYRAQVALLLQGTLQHETLREALQEVVRRFEILRTTFQFVPGMALPLQVINNEDWANIAWGEEANLEGMAPAEQEARVEALFQAARQAPLNYEAGPLIQASLAALGPERHLLLLSLPALYADLPTLHNLAAELHRAYERLAPEGEDEPIQHVAVSEWVYELLDSEDAQPGKEYWGKQYRADALGLQLPLGQATAEQAGFAAQTIRRTLDPKVFARIERLVVRQGSSVPAFMLACWQALLWRLADAPTVVVGTAFDGRPDEELQGVLGPLTRHLPLAATLERGQRFEQVLEQITASYNDALTWQDCFTWKTWSGSDEAHSANAFFPACFEFEAPAPTFEGDTLSVSVYQHAVYPDRFQLKLSCTPAGNTLLTTFAYDGARFSAAEIERLAERFQTFVASAAENPARPIRALEIVGPAERQQVVVAFNESCIPPVEEACLHQLFEAQAARTPERMAAVYEDPETGQVSSLSFGELNRRANQLAHHLRSLGVGAEAYVGLCTERSVEMVVGVLGILKAGAAYLPLDPTFPTDRLGFMLADTRSPVIVTQQRFEALLAEFPAKVVSIDAPSGALASASGENPANIARPDNVAYAIYTSGSTGKPKGVLIEHRSPINLMAGLLEAVYSWRRRPTERVSLNAPLIFDASMQQLVMLLQGYTLEIIPQSVRIDGPAYVNYLKRHRVDALDCTPSQLQILVHAGLLEDPDATPDLILTAGEAIDQQLWQRLQRSPYTTCFNIYGPTECTVDATAYRVSTDASPTPTIGRPLAHYQLYILDDAHQLVPVGSAGELYIGGVGLARGYLKRADLTAEKFVPDPFSTQPGGRLYRTGDLARWRPDGNLEFLGRVDHQVKIRGFRIELGEIETVLREAPDVQDAVVIVREDRADDKRLVAYLTLVNAQASGLVKTLRAQMQQRLPEYMVPSDIVVLPSLPLTPSGKVDRKALPAPEQVTSEEQSQGAAPRTPVEEMLLGIWLSLLNIKQMGVHDNFFELGGHSLLAIQLVSRIRDAFGIELPLNSFFNTPTIAGLAAVVERLQRQKQGVEAPPLQPVKREGHPPLSFAQQRLWFLYQLDPKNTNYNMPGAVQITGSLDVAALERSVSEIVRRHETLRTTFALFDEQPVQVIAPSAPLHFPLIDLRGQSAEAQEAEVVRLALEEATRPFNLTEGPLLRVCLVRLAEDKHVALFTMHHIVSDGWSMGVMIREMAALYEAFAAGKPSPLPELPIQYADFAMWQRGWLQGETLEKQIAYWREQLRGAPPLLALPSTRPRSAVQTFNGASRMFTLAPDLSEGLRSLSREEGVTLFMPLLAAFKTLLFHYSNQEDVVVGTDSANRNRAEVEGLIGFFVNQLVLRTDLSGDPSFRDLLKRVREVALGAYTHEDLPFNKLVETLNPERATSHSPLFQAKIVFQNAPIPPMELGNLTLTPLGVEDARAKFDLLLNLWDQEAGIVGEFVYNTDLFDASTIDRIIGHFTLVLEAVAEQPELRLSELRERLVVADQTQQQKKTQELHEARLQKFQKIKRKEIGESQPTR
jgi:amino acid adenylation domain-containing protein